MLILSCDSDPVSPTQGCTDPEACNYNEGAEADDGSCEYAEEDFDCDGNCMIDIDCNGDCAGTAEFDECGFCDGDGYIDDCGTLCEECDILPGTIYLTNDGDLWYNLSDDIYGFQFDIYGIEITGVDDGTAQNSGFDIEYTNGGSGFSRILGWSIIGNHIDSGCGTLIKISFKAEI